MWVSGCTSLMLVGLVPGDMRFSGCNLILETLTSFLQSDCVSSCLALELGYFCIQSCYAHFNFSFSPCNKCTLVLFDVLLCGSLHLMDEIQIVLISALLTTIWKNLLGAGWIVSSNYGRAKTSICLSSSMLYHIWASLFSLFICPCSLSHQSHPFSNSHFEFLSLLSIYTTLLGLTRSFST